jgi:hypothetical protein
MGVVVPHIGDEQEHLATLHVEGAMENAFGMMLPRHRDTDLFSEPPIAMIEWWGFGDNGLIKHEEDAPCPSSQAPFEPPFAWRHVAGRRFRR